jgi:hypothetical protein
MLLLRIIKIKYVVSIDVGEMKLDFYPLLFSIPSPFPPHPCHNQSKQHPYLSNSLFLLAIISNPNPYNFFNLSLPQRTKIYFMPNAVLEPLFSL